MGQYDSVRSTPASEPTDEIDLMDLFAIIWEGRWIIFAVNVIAAIAGFVVIKALPSIYRVEAVLAGPSSYQLQRLQVLQPAARYQVATDEADRRLDQLAVADWPDYQVAPVDGKSIYLAALAELDSTSLKREYWDQRASSMSGNGGWRGFAKGLQLSQPKQISDVSDQAQVHLLTEDPEAGVELLKDYLAFAEREVRAQQLSELQVGLETTLAKLSEDFASAVAEERLQLEDELVRLREAREVAQALGIVELPFQSLQNVRLPLLDQRLYLLGTAVLDEEIRALEARKDKPLEAFAPRLRQMSQWREQAIRDLQRLQSMDEVRAFNVVTPPEASLGPVKPNKLLLLVAVVFAAFIFSVFLVLFRHGWRSYKARTA